MNFVVIRGEYPFTDAIGLVVAETAEAALQQAIKENKNNKDFFCRHPVVEAIASH